MSIILIIFNNNNFPFFQGEEEEKAERCAEEYIRQQELQKIQSLEGGEKDQTGDDSKDTKWNFTYCNLLCDIEPEMCGEVISGSVSGVLEKLVEHWIFIVIMILLTLMLKWLEKMFFCQVGLRMGWMNCWSFIVKFISARRNTTDMWYRSWYYCTLKIWIY